ncbi:Hypothetical protein (Fragment), partial [Durusdinium trenchii]
ESRRRARSCDVHHSLYNKGLERMARHAEQVQQQSKERSARQVLGRSREYYWQMLDRQIRDAFDKAAKGHHLAARRTSCGTLGSWQQMRPRPRWLWRGSMRYVDLTERESSTSTAGLGRLTF